MDGQHITSFEEIRDIIIADAVLIVAFSLTIAGGIPAFQGGMGGLSTFLYYLPIAAIGVSLSFILHEMMHKFFAIRYGAYAEFRTSLMGLAITLATGAFGFLLGIPGATYIYTNSFTDKQNGIVSLVGPLTNFIVFGAFLGLLVVFNPATNSFAYNAISFTLFISIFLAFFNMLPIFPLDGSKVLKWNKPIYAVVMATIFILMLVFHVVSILTIGIMIVVAIVFSLIYRSRAVI